MFKTEIKDSASLEGKYLGAFRKAVHKKW